MNGLFCWPMLIKTCLNCHPVQAHNDVINVPLKQLISFIWFTKYIIMLNPRIYRNFLYKRYSVPPKNRKNAQHFFRLSYVY